MNDAYYVQNLDTFVKSLPHSSVRFIWLRYDDRHDEWYPKLNTTSRIWEDHKTTYDKPLYVSPGSHGSNYCYVYRESDALYDVYLKHGQVDFFEPTNNYAKIPSQTGGANTPIDANWGDHITIGLERVLGKFYLRTHKTKYVYDDDLQKYRRQALYCDVPLAEKFHDKSKCFADGQAMPYTADWYKFGGNDRYAVPIIQAVRSKIMTPTKGGANTYHTHRGMRYKIHVGPKGGKYIQINGRKMYLQTGGSTMYQTDGFAPQFIEFLKEALIGRVAKKIKHLHEVVYSDDDGSDQVIVRYTENEGNFGHELFYSSVYALDKKEVQNIFHIYITPSSQRTPDQQRELQQFMTTPRMVLVHA